MSVPPDMMTGNQGMPTSGGSPTSGGAPPWLSDLSSVVGVGGNLASLINAIQLQNTAGQNLGQSNPFGAYRPTYGNMLLQLMQNPGSVSSLPGYQFQLSQGAAARDRSAAAPGGVGFGSGAEGAQLEEFGQGLAASFYDRQIATLSQLAGANIAPANAAQMLQAAGGAAGGVGTSITGLSQSTLGMLGKLFPGTTSPSTIPGDPNAYNPATSPYTGAPGQTSVDWGMAGGTPGATPDMSTAPDTGDPFGGNSLDLSGLFTNPRAAGGEAATGGQQPGGMNWKTGFGSAADLINIIQGVKSGGLVGYGGAGLSAADLYGKMSGTNIPYAGAAGDILGIYSGLRRGGVAGYGQAAVDTMQLANEAGLVSGAGASAIPIAGAALASYNALNNYGGFQKGQYGKDIATDAAAGAAIGTAIFPGVGTLIGAAGGALVGAAGAYFGPKAEDALFPGVEAGLHGDWSKALVQGTEGVLLPGSNLFLNRSVDPETRNWSGFIDATGGANASKGQIDAALQGINPQSAFNLLAGVMDIKSGRIPIVNVFGRMGESNLLNQMTSQINSAIKSGQISASASPDQIFSQIVTPWLDSKGATIGPETGGYQLQGVLTSLIGAWQSSQLTSGTALTSSGSKDTGLSAYGA